MAAPQPPIDITTLATDSLEQLLVECESHIARLRSVQTQVVSDADRRQLPTTDGAHTMVDWVASRLDVTSDTAEAIRRVAHTDQGSLGEALKTGTSFDRVALAAIGDGDLHPELDLAALARHAARRRHVTRRQEQDVHQRRHVIIQPDLFDTSWKLRGLLPAVEGALVSQVLDHLADQLPDSPGATPDPRPARPADAHIQLCSQTTSNGVDGSDPVPGQHHHHRRRPQRRRPRRRNRRLCRVRTPNRTHHPRSHPLRRPHRSHRHHHRRHTPGPPLRLTV